MTSALQTIKIYELLDRHFSDREDAQGLVVGIEGVIATKFDVELSRLATREDLLRSEKSFKEELITTKEELSTRISTTKEELSTRINTTKEELTTRINGLEVRMEQGFKDQLRWMIGLMITFSSLIIAMLKFT